MLNMRFFLCLVFLMSLPLFLAACGLLPGESQLSASLTTQAGVDAALRLRNGAELTIPADQLPEGATVEYRQIPKASLSLPAAVVDQVAEIYEINVDQWTPELEATISLPIPEEIRPDSAAELDQYRIVYLDDETWVSVPTTIDADAMILHGVTNHFSTFSIKRFFNPPPQLSVTLNNPVYANLSVVELIAADDAYSIDLADLVIDIFAHDPDDDPVYVFLFVGFDFQYDLAKEASSEFIDHLLNKAVIELGAGSYLQMDPAANSVAMTIANTLSPPEKEPYSAGRWYLVNQLTPGHYQFTHSLNIQSPGSLLQGIRLYVRAYDSIDLDPVEQVLYIPVSSGNVPQPPELMNPGPSVLTICPPSPEFRWRLDDTSGIASYRFRLVKGDNVWGSWFDEAEWTLRGRDISWHEPDWVYVPDEPLAAGSYSWSMAVSQKETERRFDNHTESTRAALVQFTVDESLTGTECIQTDGRLPAADPVSAACDLGFGPARELQQNEIVLCGEVSRGAVDESWIPAYLLSDADLIRKGSINLGGATDFAKSYVDSRCFPNTPRNGSMATIFGEIDRVDFGNVSGGPDEPVIYVLCEGDPGEATVPEESEPPAAQTADICYDLLAGIWTFGTEFTFEFNRDGSLTVQDNFEFYNLDAETTYICEEIGLDRYGISIDEPQIINLFPPISSQPGPYEGYWAGFERGELFMVNDIYSGPVIWSLTRESSSSATPPTNTVVNYEAYLSFSGDTSDRSANAYSSTVYGATLTSNRFGNPNQAYHFDGNGSYIETDDPLTDQPPYSVSFWFKADGLAATNQYILTNGGHTSLSYGVYALVVGADIEYCSQNYPSGALNVGVAYPGSDFRGFVMGDIELGIWHHVVFTWDGSASSSAISLYIDGRLQTPICDHEMAWVGNRTAPNLRIGTATNDPNLAFAGTVDDIFVFHRILTPEEVFALYQASAD